jgi:hypothetical protein
VLECIVAPAVICCRGGCGRACGVGPYVIDLEIRIVIAWVARPKNIVVVLQKIVNGEKKTMGGHTQSRLTHFPVGPE